FGGAGGLVAVLLAEKLGITRILIPPGQGVFSAMSMLVADFKKELQQSFLKMAGPGIQEELNRSFSILTAEVEQILTEEGFSKKESQVLKFAEIRYKGQSYELTVPYAPGFIKEFHRKHQQLYSYSLNDENCEIVNLRVMATGKTGGLEIKQKPIIHREPEVFARKKVYFKGKIRQFNIYLREKLRPGDNLQAPAIVVTPDSTVIVGGEFTATIDEYKNILLESS
ncbi:hydantoinase/oxoprolinase family protein, partial [Acidobacteriota bacterium]